MQKALIIAAAVLALTACGQGSDGGKGAPQSAASAAWNAADACALVSAAEVAAVAGVAVSEAKLEGANPGGDGLATFSTCRYALADGSSITLLARKSPSPDTSAAAIEAARTMGGVAPPATPIAGLGKAGLWTPQMRTLQVFIDDQRYVTLTAFQAKDDSQAVLVSVARKAF